MFYFQTLLNQALGGIDGTGMITAVVSVAYGILLVGFLVGLYQAVMNGGDVRALGVTAIKYLVIAIIIANWSTIFHDVNNSFNAVAQYIGNTSGAGDVFLNWDKQLGQQFSDSNTSFWDVITGDISALISALLIVVAYIVYVIAIVLFCFFYTLYGTVLYVLGPLVMAFLPMAGVGQISKSFATNVMIWNAWGILYAIFGALITAIHINQFSNGVGGFLGFFKGQADSLLLGLISIFYAIAIALIPFIAKKIISGDVGSTAASLVRAAASIAGVGLSAVAGGVAGVSAGSGAASTGASGSSSGAGASGATSAGASSAASSSTPPPTPSLGQSIRAGLASAMSSNTSPATSEGASSPTGSTENGSSSTGGGTSVGNGSSGKGGSGGSFSGSSHSPKANDAGFGYRPHGVAQQLAYQGAKAFGKMAAKTPKNE